jgi:hypothetical protein
VAGEKSDSTSGSSLPWFDGIVNRERGDRLIVGHGAPFIADRAPRTVSPSWPESPSKNRGFLRNLSTCPSIQRRNSASDPVGFPLKILTL